MIISCSICTFSVTLMKVPVVLPVSFMQKQVSLYRIYAWNLEMLSSMMRIWLEECLPILAPSSFTEKNDVWGPSYCWIMSSYSLTFSSMSSSGGDTLVSSSLGIMLLGFCSIAPTEAALLNAGGSVPLMAALGFALSPDTCLKEEYLMRLELLLRKSLLFWVTSPHPQQSSEAPAVGDYRNSSYSLSPLVIPESLQKIHDIIFLMVIPDLIPSSSLRSSSVSELRQLPSIDSSPELIYTDTEFVVEGTQSDKVQPDLNVDDCPFDGLLREFMIQLGVVHSTQRLRIKYIYTPKNS